MALFRRKLIYVETKIESSMDALWEATQNPRLHQEWDLRFTDISYLPKEHEEDPQQFLYTTNIGFGLSISGEGESVANREGGNGERTSVLKFSSSHSLSLIKLGGGYWRYIPAEDGITFLTWYGYQTRFGILGRIVDHVVFRPLMGWATAWSFDALRLWLEKGIHPRLSLWRSLSHLLALWILSFIWVYQGLIPKLLFPNSGEKEILHGIPLLHGIETQVLTAIGVLEILFGLSFLLLPKSKTIHWLNICLLLLFVVGALFAQPQIAVAPFNPITFNLALLGLSGLVLCNLRDLPFASHCVRKQTKSRKKERREQDDIHLSKGIGL